MGNGFEKIKKEIISAVSKDGRVSLVYISDIIEQSKPYIELAELEIEIAKTQGKVYYNIDEPRNTLCRKRDELAKKLLEIKQEGSATG